MIGRQHLANASQFGEALRIAHVQYESWESHTARCRRCEANLDALRVAGKKSIKIGLSAVEDDYEVASIAAFLLSESESDQPDASGQAVALLRHESSGIRQAAWWGLRLASCRHVEPNLRALLGKLKWDFASAAALDILAFHRLPVQAQLGAPPDEEGDEIAWLLAEAGGRMRGAWNATHLKQFLGHASPRVREAALRASARCRCTELLEVCQHAARRSAPIEAVQFLGVVGSPEDSQLLQHAVSNRATAEAGLAGLGRLGLGENVPFLLRVLADPDRAEPAAAAIRRITGLELPRGASPPPPPSLTEEELDVWDPVRPLRLPQIHAWWAANSNRFDPRKRYQMGLCVSDDPLGPVFDQLPLAIRYDVYLRERALTPGTPDWELETWPWMQRDPGSAVGSRRQEWQMAHGTTAMFDMLRPDRAGDASR
ncbi:MAG: hypothetical protein U0572_10110 [Phycisphaerales bacterium]